MGGELGGRRMEGRRIGEKSGFVNDRSIYVLIANLVFKISPLLDVGRFFFFKTLTDQGINFGEAHCKVGSWCRRNKPQSPDSVRTLRFRNAARKFMVHITGVQQTRMAGHP